MKKVLIAHRGQIAVRIIRACQDAGLVSVAVYSDPDANALHVRLADEAYALRGSSNEESYLDSTKILEIARRAGADAVHPGDGLLAESVDFAQAVIEAGLVWIGPEPRTLRLLEGRAAGRSPARPRRIEAHVAADAHGNLVVLGSADCSLQRRGQALVAEAPAPFLASEVRDQIHEEARRLFAEARFVGVGALAFLVEGDGAVQVQGVTASLPPEHPLIEITAGVDVVLEQFRIAEGLPLSVEQTPRPNGHALSFAMVAEDPALGFLPTPGRVTALTTPAGHAVRLESGVAVGDAVPAEHGTLMGKLLVRGNNREQALRRARMALKEYAVEGLSTALPFHRAMVEEPAFTDAPFRVDAWWVEREFVAVFGAAEAADPLPASGRREFMIDVDGRAMLLGLPAGLLLSVNESDEGDGLE